MAFNFTNTSALGTSTPAKPGGFGNFSFGGQATAAPAFGGAPATQSAFGQPSAFGSTGGFGQPPATSAPAFGFGAATTSTAPSFGGFGGQPAAAAPNTMGGFGTPAPAPNAGFGGLGTGLGGGGMGLGGGLGGGLSGGLGTSFGGFGTQSSAQGGLGTTSATTTGFSGFGTGLSFGQPTAGPTPSAFSFNTPGFGAPASSAPTAFGGFGTAFTSNFGKPANTGFGTFGQPPQQQFQQQPAAPSPDEAFAQSICNVTIFGDERDTVIAKWNYLQAMWGRGKSYYSQNAPPVDITPQNFLCRFKAIGYNKMPGKDNKMGLVALVINKPESQISEQKQQLIAQLNQVLGNRPNIIVNIDNVKVITDTKCQVIMFIQEKSQTSNETKRILASDVCNVLNQPMAKSQTTSMGIEEVIALVSPDEDQLKEYLDKPPKGIDLRMWKQAIEDNPDPTKFIPVPIVGFNELKYRIQCQEKETETHALYLAKVQRDLTELKQKHADSAATILGHKRKLADLSHRILNIIVKQEITRKIGVALTPEEEELRSKLENMQARVSAPTQYKGRLSELLSQMRMQRNQWNLTNTNDYALDPDSAEEMKTFLCMQQKAMAFLIETANKDAETLKNICDKLSTFVRE